MTFPHVIQVHDIELKRQKSPTSRRTYTSHIVHRKPLLVITFVSRVFLNALSYNCAASTHTFETLPSHLQVHLDGLSLKRLPISNVPSALKSSIVLSLPVRSILLSVNIKEKFK